LVDPNNNEFQLFRSLSHDDFYGHGCRTISYPKFDPAIKFVVEKADVVGHVPNSIPTTYQLGEVNFQFSYEKNCLPMMLLLDFL